MGDVTRASVATDLVAIDASGYEATAAEKPPGVRPTHHINPPSLRRVSECRNHRRDGGTVITHMFMLIHHLGQRALHQVLPAHQHRHSSEFQIVERKVELSEAEIGPCLTCAANGLPLVVQIGKNHVRCSVLPGQFTEAIVDLLVHKVVHVC